MKVTDSTGTGRNALVLVVALLVLGGILMLLYRSASHDELPEDEWIDFEHPS